jgi:protease I
MTLLFINVIGEKFMPMPLPGKNIAILAANGFDEHQMTEIQRALTKARATIKTIAPEQGVINGWQSDGWGHYFPVDISISEALGSDFDALVLPGGERATAKLKANLHTRRIVNHFLEAGKPVIAIASGVGLLALSKQIAGQNVAAPESLHDELIAAGAIVADDALLLEDNLLTADGTDSTAWVAAALEFLGNADALSRAA